MRYTSIDAFRGFAVAAMIFFNILNLFQGIPEWLRHAEGNGLTFVDLVAPFFLFIVGVCLWISYSRRKTKRSELTKRVLKRVGILLFAGLFFDTVTSIAFNPEHTLVIAPVWGVLEAIALAYLIAFIFIRFNWKVRIAISFLLIGIYSILSLLPEFISQVQALPHGNLPGVISWSFIVLIGTVFGQFLLEKKRENKFTMILATGGVVLLILGVLLNFAIPINKTLVSSSYSVVAAGFSALFFAAFYYLFETRKIKSRILALMGINAIFAFFFHYIFVVIINYYSVWKFFNGINAALLTCSLLMVNWLVIFAANKRDWIFHI